MRWTTRWLALLAALALVFAACGDDGDDGGDAAGGGGDDEQTEELADLTGQTIEVTAPWTGSEQENFLQVMEAFEEQTGATVRFTSTGDDTPTILGTRVEGGDPPDVAMIPQPGLVTDFARRGVLQPIDDVAGDVVDEHFAPIWRELGSVDGTLYAVWFKAANKSTVWFRPDSFEEAGVDDPPEMWDDFVSTSQTLSDAGITPLSIGAADGWVLTDWFENVYLRTAGPEKYDQLVEHQIPWTDPSVTTALTELSELWGRDDLIVGGRNGALATTFDESVTQVFSEPPKGAIVYEGDFVAGVITDETETVVGEGADFFPFPSFEEGQTAVVGGGDGAVLMKDTPGGKEFIKFLATPEAAEIWAGLGGFTSANQGVDLDVYPDDITRRSAELLVEAEDFRFDMSDLTPSAFGGTPGQGMWKLLQDFLGNPTNVDGTAQALEQAAVAAYPA